MGYRKKKASAATRLLAHYTAAHATAHGRLGHASEGGGLPWKRVAAFCAFMPDQVAEHVDVLVAADCLTDTDIAGGRLRGQLTKRVLPLSGLL